MHFQCKTAAALKWWRGYRLDSLAAPAVPTHWAGLDANNARVLRDVPRDRRTRCDPGPPAHGHARENRSVRAHAEVGLQCHLAELLWILATSRPEVASECRTSSCEYIVLNGKPIQQMDPAHDSYTIDQVDIALDEHLIADVAVVAFSTLGRQMCKRTDSRADFNYRVRLDNSETV
jgi:hypothetical protein